MNPDSLSSAKSMVNSLKKSTARLTNVQTVICPPFIYISDLVSKSKLAIGAQNVFYEDRGSYTGEVSAAGLYDLGARYVIIGHSERRAMGETDEVISKKVIKAVSSNLTPVICVGEKVHDSDGEYLEVVKKQVLEALRHIKSTEIWKVIIAYEPIWAVGAASAMTSHEVYQMSLFIRKVLMEEYGKLGVGVSVLYGGSVDAENAAEIVSGGQVDGLLVGRESLHPERFTNLIKAVNNL